MLACGSHSVDPIQEQEKLIARLEHEDEERNDKFKVGNSQSLQSSTFTSFQRIFVIIPFISAAAFLPSLLTSQLVQAKLIDLLAITSLMCTAHILMSMPSSKSQRAQTSYFGRPLEANSSPIERYIDYFNGGLSFLILLNAFSYRGKQGVHEGFWLLCVLPAGGSSTSYLSLGSPVGNLTSP